VRKVKNKGKTRKTGESRKK